MTGCYIKTYQNGESEPAEVMIQNVIEEETLNADATPGFTYSFKSILLAIYDTYST